MSRALLKGQPQAAAPGLRAAILHRPAEQMPLDHHPGCGARSLQRQFAIAVRNGAKPARPRKSLGVERGQHHRAAGSH